MDVTEVIARESIRDLVARYNANGDSGRFAQVMELFAPDAEMRLEGRTYTGPDEIIEIFTGTRDRDAAATGTTPAYVRHFTATHQIDLIDAEHANGRLYYQVITNIGLDHWGRYVDTYRVVDGHWRFATRSVSVDGQMPNSTFPPSAEHLGQ